jgi:outer membrane protein OmpA-like peptidoglycan-associated protein
MRLPSLRRTLHMTLGGAVGAALALNPSPSSANVEVGATAGLHTFSVNNELGVPDIETATSLRNSALFGLRLGVGFGDMLGVEAEVGLIPTEERNLVYDVWALTYRAHVIAQFGAADANKKLIPFVLVGGGLVQVVDSGNEDRVAKDKDEAIYAGIGAKYRVENGWGLRLDGRWLLVPSSDADASGEANKGQASDFELLLSVYKEFGRKEAVKEVIEETPPPDNDPDRDGIVGDADGCPNDPEDADGFEDDNGCPDPDNDGDGVADGSDQCPTDAEDADGFKDEDGCPDPDNDGDGIADATDQCKDQPEDADSFQDEDGCPDPDNDGDGVLDAADQCQDKQETKNGYQDGDGCPDEIPAAVKKFTGVIKGINFKTGSAEILKTSNKTLDGAVKVLADYPELKLEVQGHTDDVGDDTANQELSQKRADSVKAYFEGKGIAGDRVVAKGYGETQPSVDPAGLKGGKLKAAQAKNRRVEFKLISDLTATEAPANP